MSKKINIRIGHGMDVHPFNKNSSKKFILGGVSIPKTYGGIVAHSDGDVLFHSIIDALLGATCLGDIGILYPDTSKKYKNISSSILLCDTYLKIKKKGYKIKNIDTTIILESPKIMPYIIKMKSNISRCLNISTKYISIKSTSTEKLGFIGKHKGVACQAVILLYK